MNTFKNRLALHTWTIDTTPLADALHVARDAGFNAVELRYVDFKRCMDLGMTNDAVLEEAVKLRKSMAYAWRWSSIRATR